MMKILATSDIHNDLIYTIDEYERLVKFVKELEKVEADVLVLAGDTIGLGWAKLEECLKLFANVAPQRLMVFGNHDLWSAEGDTLQHAEVLAKKIPQWGFHLLDQGPVIIDGIGFAGNSGWYDYSFALIKDLPQGYSYEKKLFDGELFWNDANFVRLGKSDPQFTKELVEKLEKDILFLEEQVATIVAITHHIGFVELIDRREGDLAWSFGNAYMGSEKIGQMLLGHPKIKYYICGHTHSRREVQIGPLLAINPGSDYKEKHYKILELS